MKETPSAAAQPAITVVMPVYNKRAFLERSLKSVLDAAEASPGVSVLVLDDASTDGSAELAAQLCEGRAEFRRIAAASIAAVRNAGARSIATPLLCFIDCDCVIERDYFAAVREVFARQDVAASGCRVHYPDDGSWVERTWDRLRTVADEGFRSYLNSGNFAVRREIFEAVGGFDESLVTDEDAELGQRLNDHGYRIFESKRLAALHLDNPTTLAAFYRKERWHAIGMLSTVRLSSIDRPMLMTVVHLVLLLAAGWLVPFGRGTLVSRVGIAMGLVLAVPLLTVLYRSVAARRLAPLAPSVVLYQAYYLARIAAMSRKALRLVGRRPL